MLDVLQRRPIGVQTVAEGVCFFNLGEAVGEEYVNVRLGRVMIVQWYSVQYPVCVAHVERHLYVVFAATAEEDAEWRIVSLDELRECAYNVCLVCFAGALVKAIDDQQQLPARIGVLELSKRLYDKVAKLSSQ